MIIIDSTSEIENQNSIGEDKNISKGPKKNKVKDNNKEHKTSNVIFFLNNFKFNNFIFRNLLA